MRNIFTVNAKQVVISQEHPEGVLSNVTGFPVSVDSRSYGATEANPNGNPDIALTVAKAEFADEVKALTVASNPNRVMWVVTLEQADGVVIDKKKYGAFPDMTPPEPEPEPNTEE